MSRDLPELLILRHGETEWNREGRWQGDLDSALTDLGREQARSMGVLLRDMGVTATSHKFFSSPLKRARDTARHVADAVAVSADQIIEDARLREISVGLWTGLRRSDIVARTGLDESAHFLEFYRAAPQAETFDQMGVRCAAFLAGLSGPAVVITHGVTSRVLRCLALGWSLDRLAEVPGGQGVIHRLHRGQHDELAP